MGLGDVGLGDSGTRGRDKQTTPDICAEFVEYNFGRFEKAILYAGELVCTNSVPRENRSNRQANMSGRTTGAENHWLLLTSSPAYHTLGHRK